MSSRKRQSRTRDSNASSVQETTTTTPFHILMASDGTTFDESKLKLTGRLQRDYLAKRYRLRQMCYKLGKDQQQTPEFWCGASPIEMNLLSCCEVPELHSKQDDDVVAGALNRSKITKFIGLAAVDCYELETRALALAILERTWEADEEAKDMVQAYTEHGQAIAISSPGRKAKLNDGSAYASIAKVGIKGKADRLLTFFAGGGLRILNQWLIDASTPVYAPPPKAPPAESGRPRRIQPSELWKPSPTGDLLLPLLILLMYSPFDLELVTESKINKQIRKLSKDADAIILEAQQNPRKINIDQHTDPKMGGLLVKNVQKALNDLKEMWKSKQKQKQEERATDPFASIKAALSDRLLEIQNFENGIGAKPEWLMKAEEEALKKKPNVQPPTSPQRASVEELGKLERDKERQQLLKGDLKRAAAERAKLMEKIRQLNHKKAVGESRRQKSQKIKKTVQWKDGHSSLSTARNCTKLEEVFPSYNVTENILDDDVESNCDPTSG